MTQTMFFVGRLFLILLCVRMQMAARLEKRSRATVEAALRQKCPGEQMCACITASNSCTRCEVNCNGDCNDLTTDGTKCFSELACNTNLLFEVDYDECRDKRRPCVCNGQQDFHGNGGSCQAGAIGDWCYVDGEADCENKDSYDGKSISVSPCNGRATTHCTWSTWSSWSRCSATCGGGSQYATRQMAIQATDGGELCQGEPVKSQQCGLSQCDSGRSSVPLKPCACNGKADSVGLGGKCGPTGWCYVDEDMSCEDMSPYNRKNISREACPATKPPCVCNGQTDLVGNGGSCQDGPKGAWCYVDGEADCDNKDLYNGNFISMSPCTGRAATSCAWSAWSSWSSCSATCGGGSQYATRSVDQQATGGGVQCEGSKKRSQQCGIKKCPTDCVWSAWSSWSSCSATCGGGSQYATRNIDQQATNGGHECKGSKKRSQECGMAKCRTDCAWSAWSSWSSCSATCGGGSQYATRQMTNKATGGGEVCEGEPVKIQQCGMNQCGYLLTSSGGAAEHHGEVLGLYDEIQHEYAGRVFKQRGAEVFIYKKDDKWFCGSSVGASAGRSFYSNDLFSKPGEWYYYDDGWQNNDPTLHFLPLTPSSCILQPSIQITSTGPAITRWPDYLGTFWIVQDVFSAGRPVWRNSKGKVLMIRPGKTQFGVYDGIEETNLEIKSASGPTCPTDTKAGHSDRDDKHAWRFWDGKWVEDNTITVQ